MSAFWKGFLACYLLVALVCGTAMKAVLPPLNPLGVAYSGVTWPIATSCVALHLDDCHVAPQRYARWFFTKDAQP